MKHKVQVQQILDELPSFPEKYRPLLEKYMTGEEVKLQPSDFENITESLSEFTRKVLSEASRVPRGHTITYSELARRLNRPEAIRAVASALGRNPLPVLIPCHRIVAVSGLGGYAFGLALKRRLLDFEKGVPEILP